MINPKHWVLGVLACLAACSTTPEPSDAKSQLVANMKRATDNHSYSRPDEAVTTHLHWDATVDFEREANPCHRHVRHPNCSERRTIDARLS